MNKIFNTVLLLAVLTTNCLAQFGGVTLATKTNKLPPENKIGMNIGGVSDFENQRIFRNFLRNAVWLTDAGHNLNHRQSEIITESSAEQINDTSGLTYFWATGPTEQFNIRIRKKDAAQYDNPGTANVDVANVGTFTADAVFSFPLSSVTSLEEQIGTDANLTNMDPGTDWVTDPAATGSAYCLDFDGIDDFVAVRFRPDANKFKYRQLNRLSVGCFVKGGAQVGATVLSHWDTVNNERAWKLGTGSNSNNKLRVELSSDGTSSTKVYESSIVAFDGTWHHVMFEFNKGVLELYIDGVRDASVNKISDGSMANFFEPTTLGITNGPFSIGMGANADATQPFSGRIDLVRAYSRLLTPREKTKVVTNDSPPIDVICNFQIEPETKAVSVGINTIAADTIVEIYKNGDGPPPGSTPYEPFYKFDPTYVSFLKRFGIIRALNWLPINRNNGNSARIQTVADLVDPNTVTQANTEFGAAIEHFLDLCTICNADPWIPFPHESQNDLIDHWAGIINNWLAANPGRVAYIEFSNELWNTQFWQCRDSDPNTLDMEQLGDLWYPAEPQVTNRRALAAGRKSAELFLRVEQTITNPNRWVSVISSQAGANAHPVLMVAECIAQYGKSPDMYTVAQYLTWRTSTNTPLGRNKIARDAITLLTGKVGNENVLTTEEKRIVDEYLANNWPPTRMIELMLYDLDHGVELTRGWLDTHRAIASANGMRFGFYEMGQHLQPSVGHGTAFPEWGSHYEAAQEDPRMLVLLQEAYKAWYELTDGDVGCYLSFFQEPRGPNSFGNFGHMSGMFPTPDSSNIKWQALDDLVQRRHFTPALAP